jgi:hypothetical protein
VATQTLIVGSIAMFLIRFAVRNSSGAELGPFAVERPRILHQLETAAPKNLVIVRYSPHRHLFREWVHNSANVDQAPVVWARDMSPAENAELIRYFSGRKAWILESDHVPHPLLRPYAP